jgi:hypothetical protein
MKLVLPLALLVTAPLALQITAYDNPPMDAAVTRFLTRSDVPLASYQATRRLSATTRGGRMRASILVQTQLDPEGGFRYEIVETEGSGAIQKRVLVPALEAERRASLGDGKRSASLTPENYEFTDSREEDTLLRVGLKPRRRDVMLLDGAMYLTSEDSDLVRVEGELSRRPSFWTRKVHVTRRYGRVMGVRVPLAMESTAQVLIVGTSTFEMTYDYKVVNGATVVKD